MRLKELGEKKDAVSEALRRIGEKKSARMAADSKISFRRYLARMLFATASLFVDGLLIPSAFQALGLLTAASAVPIAVVLIAAAASEVYLFSRIK